MPAMSANFADRLTDAIRAKGTPACVGIDPVYAQLPEQVRAAHPESEAVAALRAFGRRVLEVVSARVAIVKINIAFFEVYRGPGIELYFELVAAARRLGLIVIGDVKRGDIGHTSLAYARAQLADSDAGPGPDAVTLSPYFGDDGVEPFLEVCRAQGKGVFILVHTSNPSAGQLQHAALAEGASVAERVAELVQGWAQRAGMIGRGGLSAVGAVVAPGDVQRARALRRRMPDCVFLVPGFGAQGRSAEQVAACFRPGGDGAIVNSSRGVINAYADSRYGRVSDWADAVDSACAELVAGVSAMCQASRVPGGGRV